MSTESLDVSLFCAAFDQPVSTGQDRPQFCAFAVTAGDLPSGRYAPKRMRAQKPAANAGGASGARPITDTEPTQIAALVSVHDARARTGGAFRTWAGLTPGSKPLRVEPHREPIVPPEPAPEREPAEQPAEPIREPEKVPA